MHGDVDIYMEIFVNGDINESWVASGYHQTQLSHIVPQRPFEETHLCNIGCHNTLVLRLYEALGKVKPWKA